MITKPVRSANNNNIATQNDENVNVIQEGTDDKQKT